MLTPSSASTTQFHDALSFELESTTTYSLSQLFALSLMMWVARYGLSEACVFAVKL